MQVEMTKGGMAKQLDGKHPLNQEQVTEFINSTTTLGTNEVNRCGVFSVPSEKPATTTGDGRAAGEPSTHTFAGYFTEKAWAKSQFRREWGMAYASSAARDATAGEPAAAAGAAGPPAAHQVKTAEYNEEEHMDIDDDLMSSSPATTLSWASTVRGALTPPGIFKDLGTTPSPRSESPPLLSAAGIDDN